MREVIRKALAFEDATLGRLLSKKGVTVLGGIALGCEVMDRIHQARIDKRLKEIGADEWINPEQGALHNAADQRHEPEGSSLSSQLSELQESTNDR